MALSTRSFVAFVAFSGAVVVTGCATGSVTDDGLAPGSNGTPSPDQGDAGHGDGATGAPGADADPVPSRPQDSGDHDATTAKDSGNDDGSSDAPAGDAPDSDAAPLVDAGTDSGPVSVDAGTDAGGTCSAGSVAGFTPVWHAPRVQPLRCAPADIDAFYTACLGATATNATCNANGSSNPFCYSCIVSNSTDATWGPLIVWPNGGPLEVNVGGCIDNQSSSGNPCARAFEGQEECEHQACDATCVSVGQAGYDACIASTDSGGCAAEVSAASTKCSNLSLTTARCLTGSTFQARFKSVAQVFCYF